MSGTKRRRVWQRVLSQNPASRPKRQNIPTDVGTQQRIWHSESHSRKRRKSPRKPLYKTPPCSEVNKRGRPSKWPPECLPSTFADFECAFSLQFLGENMTPKDPFLEGTFWDKFWRPIRSRALLFTPDLSWFRIRLMLTWIRGRHGRVEKRGGRKAHE